MNGKEREKRKINCSKAHVSLDNQMTEIVVYFLHLFYQQQEIIAIVLSESGADRRS